MNGARLRDNQENHTTGGGWGVADSKAECQPSESRGRNQKARSDGDWNSRHVDPPKKQTEAKRRQGPIKPPKLPEEKDLERGVTGQEDFPVQDELPQGPAKEEPLLKAGRGQGRRAPLQDRGQRRGYQQDHRPGQRMWDNTPKNKETQTGKTEVSIF